MSEEVEKKPFSPNANFQVDVQTGGIAKKPNQDDQEINDVSKAESGEAPKKYPKVVFLIVLNEFCERFSYYGLRTILYLYLTEFWEIEKNTATAVYHAFAMLCYFSPVAGAILADGYIGLYNTILYVSMFYLLGEVVLAVTSITPIVDLTPGVAWGPAVALIIIAIGTGGIKPCVSAFGGNQFHPSQKRYLENFFSVFYLSINVGSLISTILTPIFRGDVYCFGKQCYPLAFGVPALVMAIGIVCFFIGTPYYNRTNDKNKSGKNVIVQTCDVFFLGFWRWVRKVDEPKEHWLDYAEVKYPKKTIKEVKSVWKVLIVFLPIPVFWALYDQQGSRWTDQAQQLNGKLGSITIKPDQFQAINPIFVVALVPVFDMLIYPALAKFKLFTKLLTRMAVGLMFAIAAFCIAAVLESQMQSAWSDFNRPGQLRVVNLSPCNLTLTQSNFNFELNVNAPMLGQNQFHNIPTDVSDKFFAQQESALLTLAAQCPTGVSAPNQVIVTKENLPKSLLFYTNELNQLQVKDYWYNQKDYIIGSSQIRVRSLNTEEFYPKLGFRLESKKVKYNLGVVDIDSNSTNSSTTPAFFTSTAIATTEPTAVVRAGGGGSGNTDPSYTKVDFGEFDAEVYDQETGTKLLNAKWGLETCERYTVLLFVNHQDEPKLDYVLLVDIYQNGVSLFWQLIQIFVMTIGEIMFSISGLAFAYSQAPPSMKSVLQSMWQLTVAFGNLIVVIIAEAKMVDNQVYEYLIFAGLLGLATIAFGFLGYFYKYEDQEESSEESSGADTSTSSASLPPAYQEKESKISVRMSDIKDDQ